MRAMRTRITILSMPNARSLTKLFLTVRKGIRKLVRSQTIFGRNPMKETICSIGVEGTTAMSVNKLALSCVTQRLNT